MAAPYIERVLFYTHNSIGLGHAVRTLAIITGMRGVSPQTEFLVVSGTSVPQLFSMEGIEIIKLPSTKLEIGPRERSLRPRYLKSINLEKVFDFRQRIITEAFDFFQPNALMVEHNMTGQMNELVPLQLRKWMRRGGAMDFAMCYICRGIMSRGPLLRIPYQNPRHRSESVNIGQLYDYIYVLEDREVVDVNKEFLGDDPELEDKIAYLGKITSRTKAELPPPQQSRDRFNLDGRPIILLTLGRFGQVGRISRLILESLSSSGTLAEHQAVIVLDPYLEPDEAQEIRRHAAGQGIKILPFVPNLLELINIAELVICRAGYNTVNELLLTDTKALIIAEDHAGGEQEFRIRSIPKENVTVLQTGQMEGMDLDALIRELLSRPPSPLGFGFDKYEIGRRMIRDLERWEEEKARVLS